MMPVQSKCITISSMPIPTLLYSSPYTSVSTPSPLQQKYDYPSLTLTRLCLMGKRDREWKDCIRCKT